MLKTCFEAKDCECPQNFDAPCVSSHCMGWRWHDAETEIVVTDTDQPPPGDGWEPRLTAKQTKAQKKWSWGRPYGDRRRGFCGMAGPVKSWNTAVIPAEED